MSDPIEARSPSAVFGPDGGALPGKTLQAVSVDADSFPRLSAFDATDAIIMMVDDELLNIEMTQAFLEDAGYRNFVSTHESEHAIELMRAERPHVLLLDLSMPKVSGMDILAVLREDEQLRHTPVIVMTSNSEAPTKLKALALGAMDFLAKPVDPSELGLRLRNTLAARAHRDYLANHDPLTGLRNRSRYMDALKAALASATERRHGCAVLHVGVDRLSQVNDALGRNAGDVLLQRMGRRLRQCVESELGGELGQFESQYPSLYRFDGDVFAILVPFLDEIESAAGFISSLLEAASASFRTSEREVFVTASIGVAVFPLDGTTADQIVTNAGLALGQAKHAGRNTYEFFSRELNERALNNLRIGGDLRRALGRDELSLMYQPKIDVRTGRLMGAESVIRWAQANGTVLEGKDVLQMCSTSEMSMVVGEWMMEHIVEQIDAWEAAGLQLVPLGVNLSLKQFSLPQLMELVGGAMRTGGRAEFLCLELNDASAMGDAHAAQRAMAKMRELGVRLSLDHFGTGEATLSHLHVMEVDEIKVDPAFMFRIEENKTNQALMQAMIAMARKLDIALVATGVSTLPQLAFLKNNDAQQCQGRLFNNPLAPDAFAAKWLEQAKKAN